MFPPPVEVDEELEAERERRRRRAARFGTEYIDPATKTTSPVQGRKLQTSGYREPRRRNGFVTGIDMFAEDEAQRRMQRAQRFQTSQELLEDKYKPLEPLEDEEARKARAARFGVPYEPPNPQKLVDDDLFEQRHDVPLDLARRAEAVHLYGVDVMSSEDCIAYFGDYGPTHVEWIDDSSCNVVFADPTSARRAIMGLGRPLHPDLFPDSAGLNPGDVQNLPYLWHKGEDFVKKDVHVPLLFRMATEADVKPPHGKRFSRYLWKLPIQQAKRELKRTERPMDVDDDGAPRTRGGRKRTARKRQRLGLGEVDMEDTEEMENEEEQEGAEAEEKPVEACKDVPDLRGLLKQRQEERLFSAARAGIVPAFLLPDVGGDHAGSAPPADAKADNPEPEQPTEEPMEAADGDGSNSESSGENSE
eukprot:jgi/Botrbrau1/13510/Bobra.0082s0103.1